MRNSESARGEKRLERLKTAASEAGVKLTHQRLEIFRELAASEEHPDAASIFRAVKERTPTVSLDTVYRTLWMLHDLGLVRTLEPQRDGLRFDANLEPHHHYICTRCGLVRDFESRELDALSVPSAVRQIGSIVDSHVEVRGLCVSCQREQKIQTQPAKPMNKKRRRA